jgi:hypothetical protein
MNHLLHVSAEAPQPVPPFTNILSEELVFNKRHIITFGFQLQNDPKLPRVNVRAALDAWRTMTFQPSAVGVPTYEPAMTTSPNFTAEWARGRPTSLFGERG